MSRVFATHRVEPISREGDPGRGLAAPVHDPLWGLARQRQFGELAGEDTGSPVQVGLRLRADPIDGWRPAGTDDMLPYDPHREVLEALVAGEPAGPPVAPRTEAELQALRDGTRPHADRVRDRLDAGRRLAALLPGALLADLLAEHPVVTRDDDVRLVRRAASTYPDGLAVARVVEAHRSSSDGDLAGALGTTSGRARDAREVLEEHAAWCATTYGTGPATWHAERLERRFDLATGGEVVLTAPAHTREVVDVPDLDVVPTAAPSTDGLAWSRRIPTRLRFPGMPNERFWEFEDARLSLARIDAATHDLARLALVEFSSTYGNDWFVLPIPVEHGTVVTVPEVVVRDTFGRDELVPVAGDAAWSMFEAGHAEGPQRLVVPSTTVGRLAGPVVEEVRFVRDENANLVWGLEAIVTDEAGVTHDVVAEYAATARERPALPQDADLLYRLMTDVPEHWVPFVPVHLADDRAGAPEPEHRAVALVEAVLPRPDAHGVMVTPRPRSSILAELRGVPLHEEEVGPAGVSVERRWFLARSADGGRHVWVARSVSAGRGEGASGLVFDVALDPHAEAAPDA